MCTDDDGGDDDDDDDGINHLEVEVEEHANDRGRPRLNMG